MTLFWICTVLVLVIVLVGIYFRLAPLRAVLDERRALQGMHEGRAKTVDTERDDLFKGLRSQITELKETVYLERGIANERQDQLAAERAASRALLDQLNEERLVIEGICLELNAERACLQDALYRALGPERVNRAIAEIQARRARGESTSAQGVKPDVRAEQEVTRPQGFLTPPAIPTREHEARGQKERAPSEEPVVRAPEEPMEGLRATTLPTTPEALAEQRELVAATADEGVDASGGEATRAMASSAVARALQAAAGDAEEGDNDPTLSLSRAVVDQTLGAGAGGTTRASQTAPRAVRGSAVAPPASAPPPLPPEPAWKAAGLQGRVATAPVASPPAPLRSGTLVGMPRVSAPSPVDGGADEGTASPAARKGGMVHSIHTRGGNAPPPPVPHAAKTLPSMPAQNLAATAAPAVTAPPPREAIDPLATSESLPLFDPEHATGDGEPPWTVDLEPPLYAPRDRTTDEPRRGLDDIPEADPGRHLEPHEETPRRIPSVGHEAHK